jgi:hypothetical protein
MLLTGRRGPARPVLNPGSRAAALIGRYTDAASASGHAVPEAAWSEAAIGHRRVVAIGRAGEKQLRMM